MRILIMGSGGREHALAWRLSLEGHTVAATPGNPGIAKVAEILPTGHALAAARQFRADLTVVGPEAPLVAGIVDQFRAEKLPIVGPTQANASLEGSKLAAKKFMEDAGIPTARALRVVSVDDGIAALSSFSYPVVVKADGLMAGKGVVIAHSRPEAEAAIQTLGPRLVIEEFLTGEEVSFIALCDGKNALPLEPTQDHKALYDGDLGPNTGGMGAYCDSRILDPALSAQILDTVILPVVERTGFTGFLYAGMMMTEHGPKVLEFNVRLGDPETQPLMHRLDCDFADALLASATGGLDKIRLNWRTEPSVCVVMAAHGYPGQPRTGDLITGLDSVRDPVVFQAGTRVGPNGLETAGGRVLGITARGDDLRTAITGAYEALNTIHFDGAQYRTDIGRKGLKRW